MRRFLPLLIGVTLMLMAGCQSKRDICARWQGGEIDAREAMKALGFKGSNLALYCQYYKN